MVKHYFLTLSLLMAPAMVFSMGLEDDLELKNKDAKEKVAVAQGNVPSLFDLCKQELLAKGIAGETEQEKEEYTAKVLKLEASLRNDLGSLFVPKTLFPLVGRHVNTLSNKEGITVLNKNRDRIMTRETLFCKKINVYDPRKDSFDFQSPLYTLEHPHDITLATFNEDGTRIATTSSIDLHFDTVHIWDAKDGKELFSFSRNNRINDIAFNPSNNDQIIIAYDDKTAHIYDIKKKEALFTLQHSGMSCYDKSHDVPSEFTNITSAVFVPNSNLIATTSNEYIFLWNTNTGKRFCKLRQPGHNAKKLLFSCDGSRFITADKYTALIWNSRTGERVREIHHSEDISAVALNSDGSQAMTGCRSGKACIWDANTGQLLYELENKIKRSNGYFNRYPINSLYFDTNDQIVVCTDGGAWRAWIWDVSLLKKLVHGDITQKQYELLKLLADETQSTEHHYWLRKKYYTIREKYYGTLNLGILFKLLIRMARDGDHTAIDNEANYYDRPHQDYPLDLSILARKYNTPVKELRAALDSFDPEIKDYIIKKYNIKTDWFYWGSRAAACTAGVAVAALAAYFGWKYSRKS